LDPDLAIQEFNKKREQVNQYRQKEEIERAEEGISSRAPLAVKI